MVSEIPKVDEDKLSQLDRIEYYIKKRDLKSDRYNLVHLFNDLFRFVHIIMLLIIVALSFYMAFDKIDLIIAVTNVSQSLIKPFISILIIVYLVSLIIFINKLRKLNTRFTSNPDKKHTKKGGKV